MLGVINCYYVSFLLKFAYLSFIFFFYSPANRKPFLKLSHIFLIFSERLLILLATPNNNVVGHVVVKWFGFGYIYGFRIRIISFTRQNIMVCKYNMFLRDNINRFYLFILIINTKKHTIKALFLYIFRICVFIMILAISVVLTVLAILAILIIPAILIYARAFSRFDKLGL